MRMSGDNVCVDDACTYCIHIYMYKPVAACPTMQRRDHTCTAEWGVHGELPDMLVLAVTAASPSQDLTGWVSACVDVHGNNALRPSSDTFCLSMLTSIPHCYTMV